MGREIEKLKALTVSKAKKPGYLSDGGGLYLQISPSGSKSWIFKYTRHGRAREMGLGPLHTVTLAEARELAVRQRKVLLRGDDPIDIRDAERRGRELEAAKHLTFDECAKQYIEGQASGWKNPKHRDQWENTLATYASPHIGTVSVADVDTGLVLKCLEPIWSSKTETATRLRGRIEKVLDWAKTRGYRTGENPAQWKGHLEHSLAKPNKISKVTHHAALPYQQIGAFMAELRKEAGIAAKALEFTILTACRTGEVIGATWSEIDRESKLWIVPGERMKMGAEHRVPLCARALKILDEVDPLRTKDGYIFPGLKEGKPLSNMAMLALLDRMGRGDLTVHGFRSCFRDWAAETTGFPREICEKALAHLVGDESERAYQRGDLLEKRRRMMDTWSRFCAKQRPEGEVVPMRSNSAA
ncbi:MAG: integrase arm-type DNA-binding domain-containing protein [Aromatoleum sp.]|jgi:integrase|uniref:tyrosine-type recombinase/integrase n=1 Tax=Aromatoleum sp. TaxID=2307007 RepID=UPI0028946561|nr:integrase arm-type DNA-binding domain-containing protein [Aromatoleum sp.]MDT3669515.1 integrase arm-type DNA-binding domain-containing protein [Aromatoleum sp.]